MQAAPSPGHHGRAAEIDRRDLLARLAELRRAPWVGDGGRAAARAALAWLFIYHGAGTLFGAFHGAGIDRMATFFSTVAHLHPGTFFAVLNGITEFFGGIAVGIGLLSRLAAVGLFVDMVMAMATVTFRNGIVSSAAGSGYEINVALAGLALVVAFLGAGRISVDAWIGKLVAKRAPRPPEPHPAPSP
jgi:putative oxidoreductase